jgi:hypothetical protein
MTAAAVEPARVAGGWDDPVTLARVATETVPIIAERLEDLRDIASVLDESEAARAARGALADLSTVADMLRFVSRRLGGVR